MKFLFALRIQYFPTLLNIELTNFRKFTFHIFPITINIKPQKILPPSKEYQMDWDLPFAYQRYRPTKKCIDMV